MPAIGKDGDMMVPVKENKWLFVDDNEEGIQKLWEFREYEELHPKSTRSRSVGNLRIQTEVVT